MDALPAWIDPEAWAGFTSMRVKVKKPLTDRAKRMLLKRLTALHETGNDVNACLEQSEFNCWTDVYAIKGIPRAAAANDRISRQLETAAHMTGTFRNRQQQPEAIDVDSREIPPRLLG